MTDKDFKVGDIVVFTGIRDKDIKRGAVCQIIADKDTPYKPKYNPLMSREIYPDKGKDFIINEFSTDEEIVDNVTKAFVSVLKSEISHHKRS